MDFPVLTRIALHRLVFQDMGFLICDWLELNFNFRAELNWTGLVCFPLYGLSQSFIGMNLFCLFIFLNRIVL